MNQNQILGIFTGVMTSAALCTLLTVSCMEPESSAPRRGSVFAGRTERLVAEHSEAASDPRGDSLGYIVADPKPQRTAAARVAPAFMKETLRDAVASTRTEGAPKMGLTLRDVPMRAEATVQAMVGSMSLGAAQTDVYTGAETLDERPKRVALSGGRGMSDGMTRRFDRVVTQGR